MKPLHPVYTFGYHGKRPGDLAAKALAMNAVVFDIRFSPRSQQPEWSGEALRDLLGRRNYRHLPTLGNRNFKGGPIAIANLQRGIDVVLITTEYSPAVLLCQCPDEATCHRHIVAEILRNHGCNVSELEVGPRIPLLREPSLF